MDIEAYMLWIWLALFVTTVVVEAATQDLVSIWFAVGSLIALAVCGFCPFWAEIIVFSVVSLAALYFTRPLVKKLMVNSERFTNVDELVGKQVLCEKSISKFDAGEVKLNGIIYTAILMEDSNKNIEKGTIVEVVALKGNKIVVKEVSEANEKIEIIDNKGE